MENIRTCVRSLGMGRGFNRDKRPLGKGVAGEVRKGFPASPLLPIPYSDSSLSFPIPVSCVVLLWVELSLDL